jgi:hypothetical protein
VFWFVLLVFVLFLMSNVTCASLFVILLQRRYCQNIQRRYCQNIFRIQSENRRKRQNRYP